jgi:CRISPR-associated protein Csd1
MFKSIYQYAKRNNIYEPWYQEDYIQILVNIVDGKYKNITFNPKPKIDKNGNNIGGRKYNVPITFLSSGELGLRSKFLCDTIKNALGYKFKKGEKYNEKNFTNKYCRCREYFINLIEKEFSDVKEIQIIANIIKKDYKIISQDIIENIPKDIEFPKVIFTINGKIVTEIPGVLEAWANYVNKKLEEETIDGNCIITGNKKIMSLIPHNIHLNTKGIPLVCFDSDSFKSYGFESGQNCNFSVDAALTIMAGMNYLINEYNKNKLTHIFGENKLLIWTDSTENINPYLIDNPKDVAEYIKKPSVSLSGNFYAIIIGENGRIIIRSWYQSTIKELKENITKWYEDISIDNNIPSFYNIFNDIVMNGKTILDKDKTRLFESFLQNRPIDSSIINLAIQKERSNVLKNKHNSSSIPNLLKIYSIRKGLKMDDIKKSGAYKLGKILSLVSKAQLETSNNKHDNYSQKYWNLCISQPKKAFSTINTDFQTKYARLLRKEKSFFIESELKKIIQDNIDIPKTLSEQNKINFILGFNS